MNVVENYGLAIDQIRHGERTLAPGSIAAVPKQMLNQLRTELAQPLGTEPIPAHKIAGLMTIVADASVLFTTRDWSVAGTLSTMAGGLAATAAP